MPKKPENVSKEPVPVAKVEMIIDEGVGEYAVMIYPHALSRLLKRPLWLGVLFMFLGLVLGVFVGWAVARKQEGPFPSRGWVKSTSGGYIKYVNKSSGDECHWGIGVDGEWGCEIHDSRGEVKSLSPCQWKWPWGVVCAEDKANKKSSADDDESLAENTHYAGSAKPIFQGWLHSHLKKRGKTEKYEADVKTYGKKWMDEALFGHYKNEFQSFIKGGGAVPGTKPYGVGRQAMDVAGETLKDVGGAAKAIFHEKLLTPEEKKRPTVITAGKIKEGITMGMMPQPWAVQADEPELKAKAAAKPIPRGRYEPGPKKRR